MNKKAYQLGYNSAKAGMSKHANSYRNKSMGQDYADWEAGYDDYTKDVCLKTEN